MTEEQVIEDDSTPALFGILDVKCDEHFLFKTGLGGERIFEVPLVEVGSLELQRSFAFSRYIAAALSAGCVHIVYSFIGNEWIKWGVIILLAIIILGLVTDPWDLYIKVESKYGEFDIDVNDTANEKDLEAFIVAVQSRVKQRKNEMG